MKKIFYRLFAAILVTGSLSSCQDFFNPDTNDMLLEDDYIGSFTELYSGYMGVASSVQLVADKAIYLEGLRGDFLEPTYNATQEFWDVYNYVDIKGASLKGNELADPKGYYQVILNANDFIAHAAEYKKNNPNAVTEQEYYGIVGGAVRFKVWAYLMLAKIYGEAIYVDDHLVQYQDITKYPTLDLDQIINKCIDLMLVGQNGVNGMLEFDWARVLDPSAGIVGSNVVNKDLSRNYYCPRPECLLAELYLFRGDYQQVWNQVIKLIGSGTIVFNDNYAIHNWTLDKSQMPYAGKWFEIFKGELRQNEHMSVVPFNYDYHQTNNIIKYFSNTAPNLYYMRPTLVAIDRYVQNDDNNRGDGFTYNGVDETRVFRKLIRNYEGSGSVYKTVGLINLYRSKEMYAFLVEALIGMGRFHEALIFLNNGDGIGDAGSKDLFAPGKLLAGYPRSLKGVRSSNKGSYAYDGIKGNAGAPARPIGWNAEGGYLENLDPDPNVTKWHLDSILVEEVMMESAGESRGLFAMIRMSKRWGADTRKLWAKKVAAKYNNGAGDATIEAKLSADINNWFIKYDLK